MSRTDWKVLFTALAFLAVAMRAKKQLSIRDEDQIRLLARLIEDFCFENFAADALSARGGEPRRSPVEGRP